MSEDKLGHSLSNGPGATHSNPAGESRSNWSRVEVARLVDQERAQIGHDLHDDLVPLLYAARAKAEVLSLKLSTERSPCDPVEAAASLNQIASWMNEAMQWSRRLLGSIHSLDFSIRTWKEAAQEQVNEICRDVELVWHIGPETEYFANDFAIVAFRVTVESVRNAVRHGKAKRVEIASIVDLQWYRITITDDGIGFDPSAVTGDHFGLQVMQGRAELAGGKLTVRSSPGHSTCVELKLPHSGLS